MATIQQQMTLTDGVTNVLKRMTAGLDKVAMSFKMAGRAATSMEVQTAAATAGVQTLGATASGVFASIKAGMGALLAPMAGLFAIQSLAGYISQAVSSVGSLGAAELKLTTIMRQRIGATDKMVESIKGLIGQQEKVGIVNREVQTAGAQQLATFAKQQKTLEALIPAMNNLLVQQNGYASTAESATQIANMMGRALTGQTGALTRVGISFSDAQEQVIKFGTEEEKAAVLAQIITDNVGKMNEVFGSTAAGKAAQAQMRIDEVMRSIGKSIKGNITAIKPTALEIQRIFIEVLGGALVNVTTVIRGFITQINAAYTAIKPRVEAIGKAVQSVYPYIRPVVLAAASAFAAYKLALIGAWIWQQRLLIAEGLSSAATAINTAVRFANLVVTSKQSLALSVLTAQTLATQIAMIAATFATQGWTAGMIALDAAMAANPIGFIVVAIYILIGAVFAVTAAFNHFAGTSLSAVGIIAGGIAWLGSHLYNFAVYCFNILEALADFAADVWKDPLAATYNLFATIWNNILTLVGGAVNDIIKMIAKIPGMEKLAGGGVDIGSYRLTTKYIEGSQATPWYNLDRYANRTENAEKWYDKAAGWVDGILNPDTGIPKAVTDGLNASELNDSSDDTAGNTGKMAEAMEITNEDLKYLRDIAQQEAINKYTTASVKIDMGGVSNNISNGVDVDGMMMRLTNGLRDGIANGGEKVRAMV